MAKKGLKRKKRSTQVAPLSGDDGDSFDLETAGPSKAMGQQPAAGPAAHKKKAKPAKNSGPVQKGPVQTPRKKAKWCPANADIVHAAPAEQAAWLRQGLSEASHSSAAALETDFLSRSAVVALPREGSLEAQLSAAAQGFLPELSGRGLPKGAPAVVFVCPAAMDAVSLIRQLPTFNKECRVAKLFAKHFKVEQQQRALEAAAVGIACGTPHRLCKLADLGALRIEHLRLLVLDVHADAKQRTILDIPETRADLRALLTRHVGGRVSGGNTKLALMRGASAQGPS